MKKMIYVLIGFTALISQSVYAEIVLNADEARALFNDVTFDGYNELKEKRFKIYSSADGSQNLKKKNGKRKTGEWSIDESGRHCVEFNHLKCGKVVNMGDGVYHKYMNNVHTHTLKNFRKGNQL